MNDIARLQSRSTTIAGLSLDDVTLRLGVNRQTVFNWREDVPFMHKPRPWRVKAPQKKFRLLPQRVFVVTVDKNGRAFRHVRVEYTPAVVEKIESRIAEIKDQSVTVHPEVAEKLLGVSRHLLDCLRKNGKLEAVWDWVLCEMLPRRGYRFYLSSINKWLSEDRPSRDDVLLAAAEDRLLAALDRLDKKQQGISRLRLFRGAGMATAFGKRVIEALTQKGDLELIEVEVKSGQSWSPPRRYEGVRRAKRPNKIEGNANRQDESVRKRAESPPDDTDVFEVLMRKQLDAQIKTGQGVQMLLEGQAKHIEGQAEQTKTLGRIEVGVNDLPLRLKEDSGPPAELLARLTADQQTILRHLWRTPVCPLAEIALALDKRDPQQPESVRKAVQRLNQRIHDLSWGDRLNISVSGSSATLEKIEMK